MSYIVYIVAVCSLSKRSTEKFIFEHYSDAKDHLYSCNSVAILCEFYYQDDGYYEVRIMDHNLRTLNDNFNYINFFKMAG